MTPPPATPSSTRDPSTTGQLLPPVCPRVLAVSVAIEELDDAPDATPEVLPGAVEGGRDGASLAAPVVVGREVEGTTATKVVVVDVACVVAGGVVVDGASSSRMVTVAGDPYWKFGFTSQPPPSLSRSAKVSSGSSSVSWVVETVIVLLISPENSTRWSTAT